MTNGVFKHPKLTSTLHKMRSLAKELQMATKSKLDLRDMESLAKNMIASYNGFTEFLVEVEKYIRISWKRDEKANIAWTVEEKSNGIPR